MPKFVGTAIVAALLLFSMGRPSLVLAHADYDKSEPPEDGVVKTSPALVTVWFTEGVKKQGTKLVVTDSQGESVDKGDTTIVSGDADHKTVTVGLQPNLPAGTYKVEWTSVSDDDGDEDEGDFSFKIDPSAGGPATSSAAPAPAPVATPAPTAVRAAAPAAPPVAQTVATPATVAQVPRALPQTGESGGDLPLAAILVAALLLLTGLAVRWSPGSR